MLNAQLIKYPGMPEHVQMSAIPVKLEVIGPFYQEHEIILNILDELETINLIDSPEKLNSTRIKILLNTLHSAEPHHQREEEVLFPQLEERGISCPPKVMLYEHDLLRQMKHDLNHMVIQEDFEAIFFNSNLWQEKSRELIQLLRQHISKENEILYPMVMNHVENYEVWIEMLKACEKIGLWQPEF